MKIELKDKSKIQNPKSKILLWDIDGTLMISKRGGAFKDYFEPTLRRIFGTSGKIRDLHVSGMTDLQIAAEALRDEIALDELYAKVEEFRTVLVEEMEKVNAVGGHQFVMLEGVSEVLAATQANPNFLNVLLTGNLPTAAKFKLDFIGISEFFDFSLSAFGDKSHERRDLPKIAAENVSRKFDYDFKPSQFIIIGDTPNDIACARHFGAKIVSVATGRNHPQEQLLALKPDALLENLVDTREVLRVLESV